MRTSKVGKVKIVNRKEEQGILQEVLSSVKAEFVAIYGRRRVGKTYLVKTFFQDKNCIFFQVIGSNSDSLTIQINRFVNEISNVFYSGTDLKQPDTWEDAFLLLTKSLNLVPKNKKIVLFFDEFPWMVTRRSCLVQTLEYYWNRYWIDDSRIKLIICGSSASWIIKNIVNNKGGLHNRLTQLIELRPFTLKGTKDFLIYKGIKLNSSQTLQLYMVTGGIPHYLEQIKRGYSAAQNIDMLCFRQDGLLFKEFDNLFASLFSESSIYIDLIRIIANHHYGINQATLFKKLGDKSRGGSMVSRLKDLEDTGFIISFVPYQHKQKGIHYRLSDEYTLYYLYWVEPLIRTIRKLEKVEGYWESKINSPTWKAWSGYAFESICYKHIANIRKALKLGADAVVGTWSYIPKTKEEDGAQIDLLFDRQDDAISICEIKYTNKPFELDKQYARNLLNKIEVFKKITKTSKQIFVAMISANGLKPTVYSEELVTDCVTLEDLFKEG